MYLDICKKCLLSDCVHEINGYYLYDEDAGDDYSSVVFYNRHGDSMCNFLLDGCLFLYIGKEFLKANHTNSGFSFSICNEEVKEKGWKLLSCLAECCKITINKNNCPYCLEHFLNEINPGVCE